jgi:hypothetical protein
MHKYGVSAVYTDGMESDVISLDIAFSSNKPVSRKERVAVKGIGYMWMGKDFL